MKTCLEGIETHQDSNLQYQLFEVRMKTCLEGIETPRAASYKKRILLSELKPAKRVYRQGGDNSGERRFFCRN